MSFLVNSVISPFSIEQLFCSFLAKTYSIEVIQLFPVRGNSFGQCDRNFVFIKSNLKRREVVVPQPYLDNILNCRKNPSPFVLVNDHYIIYNWSETLEPYFCKTLICNGNRFGIQQYCFIKYKPCGTIEVYKSYSQVYEPFKYLKQLPEETALGNAPAIPLKAGKVKDVKDFYPFLKPSSQVFYEHFFAAQMATNGNAGEQDLYSESEFKEGTEVVDDPMDIL